MSLKSSPRLLVWYGNKMNKLTIIILAILVLGSPVYGQSRKSLTESTCHTIGDTVPDIKDIRDVDASKETVKSIFKNELARIEPARLRYALINNMNELIDAVYSSNCNGDECIAKFYPIAYDECMKDFKDFAHTQGLSWE